MDSQFQIFIHTSIKCKQGQGRYGVCYFQDSFMLARTVNNYTIKLEFGTTFLSVLLRTGLP